MKDILFLFISFTCSIISWAQCEIIEKASIYYCRKDYPNTLITLNQLKDKYPYFTENPTFIQAIGHLNFLIGNYDIAISELEKFIKIEEVEDINQEYKSKFECNLNFKPDSSFYCHILVRDENEFEYLKESSCNELTLMLKEKERFEDALKYIKLAGLKYSTGTGCGNGDYSNQLRNALLTSEIYEKLKLPNEAIRVLVRFSFTCTSGLNLGYPNEAYIHCKSIINSSSLDVKELKNEIDSAINHITCKTSKLGPHEFIKYFIKFDGHSIEIEYPYFETLSNKKVYTLDDIKQIIFNDDFYHLLSTTPTQK